MESVKLQAGVTVDPRTCCGAWTIWGQGLELGLSGARAGRQSPTDTGVELKAGHKDIVGPGVGRA